MYRGFEHMLEDRPSTSSGGATKETDSLPSLPSSPEVLTAIARSTALEPFVDTRDPCDWCHEWDHLNHCRSCDRILCYRCREGNHGCSLPDPTRNFRGGPRNAASAAESMSVEMLLEAFEDQSSSEHSSAETFGSGQSDMATALHDDMAQEASLLTEENLGHINSRVQQLEASAAAIGFTAATAAAIQQEEPMGFYGARIPASNWAEALFFGHAIPLETPAQWRRHVGAQESEERFLQECAGRPTCRAPGLDDLIENGLIVDVASSSSMPSRPDASHAQ